MRKKLGWLLVFLTFLTMGLLSSRTIVAHASDEGNNSWLVSQGLTVPSKNIDGQVTGVGASDAKIKETGVGDIPNTTPLEVGQQYTLTYNWSVPDSVGKIQAGDYVNVTFPSTADVQAAQTLLYDVNDSSKIIAVLIANASSSTGKLVFQKDYESADTNRHGYFMSYASGTKTTSSSGSDQGGDYIIAKRGWAPHDVARPTYITWDIAFNPQNKNYGDTEIKDVLGPNQKYVDGSLAMDSDKMAKPTSIDVNGSVITFKFTNVQTELSFTYRVVPTNGAWGATENLGNRAELRANNGVAGDIAVNQPGNGTTDNPGTAYGQVSWNGGSGSGTGDPYRGQAILTKSAKGDESHLLSGAYYNLYSGIYDKATQSTKTPVENNVSDNLGQVLMIDLAPGSYYFMEQTPPLGYTRNSDPVPFSITTSDSDSTVYVKQEDEISSSSSSSTPSSSSSTSSSSSSSTPSSSSSTSSSSSSSTPSSSSSTSSSSSSSTSSSSSSTSSSSSSSTPSSSSSTSSSSSSSTSSSSSSTSSSSSSSTSSLTSSSSSNSTSSSSSSVTSNHPGNPGTTVTSVPSTSSSSSTPVGSGGNGGNGTTSNSDSSDNESSGGAGGGGTSTPTSSAKRTTGGGAATTPQTQSHGKQAVSRLPQTSDQKLAGVMLIGFLLLGGALSYTAWRRNRD